MYGDAKPSYLDGVVVFLNAQSSGTRRFTASTRSPNPGDKKTRLIAHVLVTDSRLSAQALPHTIPRR